MRLELLGTGWAFAKIKNPAIPQMRTATTRTMDLYIKFLSGPAVWGQATWYEVGTPIATPHIGQVMAYDYQLRKRATDNMNQGLDFEAALTEAKEH